MMPDRIESALRGQNPTVLRRLDAGFACIGEAQFLPGYCELLTDTPNALRLSHLPRRRRLEFLADLDLLAEAVERVCTRQDPELRRVDLEVLGDAEPYLHAHVRPRYGWEPEPMGRGHVSRYPQRHRCDPATALGPRHDDLRAELTAEIDRLCRTRRHDDGA